MVASMKGLFLSSYLEVFAYKLNAFIGMFTQLVGFFIQYYLWLAVFESADAGFYGFEKSQYLTYICGGLIIGQLTQHNTDRKLSLSIRTGDVVFNLVRPINLVLQFFSEAIGRHTALLYSFIPLLIVFFFYIDVDSISKGQLPYFFASTILAFVLSFQISFMFGLLAFFTTNTWGLFLIRMNLFPILSGQLIAVSMLGAIAVEGSGWLSTLSKAFYYISYLTPLQGTFFTPSSILSGLLTGTSMYIHICLQIIWTIALALTGGKLFKILSSRFNIQGA